MNKNVEGKPLEALHSAVFGAHLIRNNIPGNIQILSAAFKKFLGSASKYQKLPHENVRSAQFSPDGTQVLTTEDTSVKLWNSASGNIIHIFPHNDFIRIGIFNPAGTQILTASNDCTVKLWDVTTGTLMFTFQHDTPIEEVFFSASGTKIITAPNFPNIPKVWDALTGQVIDLFKNTELIATAIFNADESSILTTSVTNNSAQIWDVARGELKCNFPHNDFVYRGHFTPTNSRVLTVSSHFAKLGDTNTGRVIRTFRRIQSKFDEQLNHDGTQVLTGEDHLTVKLYDCLTGVLVNTLQHESPVFGAQFSPDGLQVLSHTKSCAILWNAQTAEIIQTFRHNCEILDASFSPDGMFVITSIEGGQTVCIWDSITGEILYPFENDNVLYRLHFEFSPQGKILKTLYRGNYIKLWDTTSKCFIRTFKQDDRFENFSMFSPDDSQIMTQNKNCIEIWDLPNYKDLEEFFLHLTVNQAELLQAFELAIRERSRIHIYNDSSGNQIKEIFKTFPLSVQRKLKRFIVQKEKQKSPQNSSSSTSQENLNENPH